jgi:hypothetical protein
MQSKQSEDRPAGVANDTHIRIGSRVREKGNEGARGTVIILGTEARGWVGYAWIKFDHRSGAWVDLAQLEVLGTPGSAAQPVAGEAAPTEQHKR